MKIIRRFAISALCALPVLWVACEDIVPGEELNAPVIMQGSSNNVTRTTINLTGSFKGINNQVKEMGVVYSTSNGFADDTSEKVTVEGELSDNVSITLENLSPDTQYYYYWYISSGKTTVKSSTQMFKTVSTSAPVFGEAVVDSLDENVIRVRTSIQEVGNNCLLECGMEYRKKIDGAKFIPVECEVLPTNDSLGYSVTLTELDSNTEYEIRPYAQSSDTEDAASGTMEGYGDVITAKTLDKVSPVVETKTVLNVGISAATLVGVITKLPVEDSEVTEKGFCLSRENRNPTVYDSTLVVTDATELNKDYLYQLSDLEYNTTYYVRAYAKNIVEGSERVGYGTEMQFTTSQMVTPEVEMGYTDESTGESYYVNMTSNSATCYATLRNLETSVLKERGFIWSEDNRNIELEEARENNHLVTAEGMNSMYTATIEDLIPNRNYYIRAYAIYQSGNITNIGYSGTHEAYTSSRSNAEFRDVTYDPELSSPVSLFVSSGITKTGDGEITEYGFVWHTNYDVTLENCVGYSAVQSENIDKFNLVIDSLKPNTRYYVKTYAKIIFQDNEEVQYSNWGEFNTRDIAVPNFYEIVFDTEKMTYTSIPVSVVVEDLGDGEVKEGGFIWGYDYNMTTENCLGKMVADGTDYKNMSIVATGLEPGRETVFRAYLTIEYNNETTTYYSNGRGQYIQDIQNLNFRYLDLSTTYNSISVSTGITNPEGVEIIEKGFLWNEGDNDLSMESYTGKIVSTEERTDTIAAVITGLKPDTRYSVAAYAKYICEDVENVSIGARHSLNTGRISEPNFRDLNIESVNISSVKLNGSIVRNSDVNIKEKGFIWGKDNGNGLNLDNYEGIVAITDTTLYSMSTTIDMLDPDTPYLFGMYVKMEYEGVIYQFNSGYWYRYMESLSYSVNKENIYNTTADLEINVDETDVPDSYEEVGVFYAEDNQLTINEIENKVPATMDEEGIMKVSLTNLKVNTKYYYGVYIKLNGKYFGRLNSSFSTRKKPEMGDVESPGVTN